MDENINLKGVFSLTIFKGNSNHILEQYTDYNLVVDLGKTNAAKLLGGDAAGVKISQIAIGDSNTAPTVADTALSNQFAKAVDSVSYPTANSVMFSWSLSNIEGNGITIRELGLLNLNGILCARKVRADIVKTSAIRLVGTWQLFIN